MPEVVFIKNRGRCVIPGQRRAVGDVATALPIIRENESIFIKPIAAGKGKGVHRIDAVGDGFQIDNLPVSAARVVEFLQGQDGWFLSQTAQQHPALAQIFPYSTNTVRIITLRDPHTGQLRVFLPSCGSARKKRSPWTMAAAGD